MFAISPQEREEGTACVITGRPVGFTFRKCSFSMLGTLERGGFERLALLIRKERLTRAREASPEST